MNGASRRRRARIPEGIGARQTSPLGGIFLKIRESDSDIGVALTKRYDTLTKMLDATKGYAKHEAELLAEIVKLCKGMSMGERGEAKRRMDELAGRINVLAEAYPDLKASENFRQLQFSIVEVEEHLQAARRIYNMNVSQFNRLLVSWPSSMVGSIHRHIRIRACWLCTVPRRAGPQRETAMCSSNWWTDPFHPADNPLLRLAARRGKLEARWRDTEHRG